MAKKEFSYRGKTVEEIKNIGLKEFMEMIPSRSRRCLKRGFSHSQKILLDKINKNKGKLKTQSRDMVIIPQMLDKTIQVYNGKEWVSITIMPHMLGHCLGEFALSRKKVAHSSPGVGATKSSASASVR